MAPFANSAARTTDLLPAITGPSPGAVKTLVPRVVTVFPVRNLESV
jgi:hypothetical protein